MYKSMIVLTANQRRSRLVYQPTGAQPLVDGTHNNHTSSALHHPRLHGPADYSRHHQQEGKQTQGTPQLWFEPLCCLRFINMTGFARLSFLFRKAADTTWTCWWSG